MDKNIWRKPLIETKRRIWITSLCCVVDEPINRNHCFLWQVISHTIAARRSSGDGQALWVSMADTNTRGPTTGRVLCPLGGGLFLFWEGLWSVADWTLASLAMYNYMPGELTLGWLSNWSGLRLAISSLLWSINYALLLVVVIRRSDNYRYHRRHHHQIGRSCCCYCLDSLQSDVSTAVDIIIDRTNSCSSRLEMECGLQVIMLLSLHLLLWNKHHFSHFVLRSFVIHGMGCQLPVEVLKCTL